MAVRDKLRSLHPPLSSPTFGVPALTSRRVPLVPCWSNSQTLRNSCLQWNSSPLSRRLIVILLLRANVHPHPGPPSLSTPRSILQWNCNGLRGAAKPLAEFLHTNDVKVACIQETKLKLGSKDPAIPGFTIVRRDRPGGGYGGGVAILIHHSVSFTPIDTSFAANDPHLELIAVNAKINNAEIKIFNVYCPPSSSCGRGYFPDISTLFNNADGDALILGDWNGHDSAWFSPIDDDRGDHLVSEIEMSNFVILNQDSPTRLPGSNQRSTSPDISLILAHLALAVNWSVDTKLSSDHLPISISFVDDQPNPRVSRSFTNFHRANWNGFRTELESLVSLLPPPSSCASGEKKLRHAILTASKHNVPAGFRKDHVPCKNREISELEDRFDDLRQRDPNDPTLGNLALEIKSARNKASRDKWQNFVDSLDRRANPKRFWLVLRSLSGKRVSTPPNQPINFNGRLYTKHGAIAKRFNSQYTNIKLHTSNKVTRVVQRNLHNLHKLNDHFRPFTSADTLEAIKSSSNSTATGPDGLTILHLKHAGPLALDYLTELFNLSVAKATLPAVWKRALVLPVLKPGKLPSEGPSYRPISLLCPASKVLERLIHPYLQDAFELNESQHGFRPRRSTTSALLPMVATIVDGFNEVKPPKRTLAVAIDLSRAFDTVNHDILLTKISETPLNSNLVRWLSTYLRGREQAVIYNGRQSPFKKNHRGVPQGAVISPTLFNLYVSKFPGIISETTSFADDFTIYASAVNIADAESQLTEDLDLIKAWAADIELDISAQKSSVTLFSPSTHEYRYHPQVLLGNSFLPLAQNPKILGVTFDPLLTFSPHVKETAKKVSQRLRIMKSLAGTSWGQDKESLLVTYKTLIRTKIDFAAPVWVPNAKPSPVKRLQSVQNAGLRLATGSHKMASQSHLHNESKMLSVQEHLNMLSAQFLASALRVDHPAHEPVSRPAQRRDKKKSLQSRFLNHVAPHLINGSLPRGAFPATKSAIHTDFVSQSIASHGNHPLLNVPAPAIHSSESRLPRSHRSTLSQLRSGHCAKLQSYLHRTDKADLPTCPHCKASDETVQHIFDCPSFPTDLSPSDLWSRPTRVASFLSSHLSFSLSPLDPLRDRPPPEPPP